MNSIRSASVILAYSLILTNFLPSAIFAPINSPHGYDSFLYPKLKSQNTLEKKAVDGSDSPKHIENKNNGISFSKTDNNNAEFNKIYRTSHDVITAGNGTTHSVEIQRYVDKLVSNHYIPSETNIHALQTNADYSQSVEQGKDAGIPDTIVRQLGDYSTELSLDQQNKVMYFPIYSSDDSQVPGNSKSHHNEQNHLHHRPHNNAEKKVIGLVGLVFVRKNQHGDGVTSSHDKGYDANQNNYDNNFPQSHPVYQSHHPSGVTTSVPQNNGYEPANVASPEPNKWQIIHIDNQIWKVPVGAQIPQNIPNDQEYVLRDQKSSWSQGKGGNRNRGQKYDNRKNNVAKNRPIPENPLFPNRMNSHGMRGKSINNPQFSRGKNMFGNSPKHKIQTKTSQNIHPNSKNTQSHKYNTVPTTDGDDHFIPVIKHIIVTKDLPTQFSPSKNENYPNQNYNNQGKSSNSQNLNQNSDYSPLLDFSNLGNDNINPKKGYSEEVPANINVHQNYPNQQQIYNTVPVNHPSIDLHNQNIHSDNHNKIPNENSYEIYTFNKNNQNHGNRVNQGNVDSNLKTQIIVQKINPNQNSKTYQSSGNRGKVHYSQQTPSHPQYSNSKQSPNNQNFAHNAEIQEALRVAGIYLQNHNHIAAQSRSSTPGSFRLPDSASVNLRVQPKKSNHSTSYFDNIRPTTDQRYNALVHERNNNLNIVKMSNSFRPSSQNMKHTTNYDQMNFTPLQIPGSTNSFTIGGKQFVRLPMEENGWKVIKSINNPNDFMRNSNQNKMSGRIGSSLDSSKINYVDSNVNYVENGNHQKQTESPEHSNFERGRQPEVFQVKDMITDAKQIKFVNDDVNLNKLYNTQQSYGISAAQIQKRFPELNIIDSKNDGTIVFTGINNKDWSTTSNNNNERNGVFLQQRDEVKKENPITKLSSKSVHQGHPSSGERRNNYNRDSYPRSANTWSNKDFVSSENRETKNNSGKRNNSNASNVNDADGADPNGFGGESFW